MISSGWPRLVGLVFSLVFFVLLFSRLAAQDGRLSMPKLASDAAASPLPCEVLRREKPYFFLVLGQSNAGNHGTRTVSSLDGVVSLVRGNHCFQGRDPLPGATGRGGSIWSRLPALLHPHKIAISVVAVESTAISQWVRPGFLAWELRQQALALKRLGIAVDLVLWQQGEADAKGRTRQQSYSDDFMRLVLFLRSLDINAPIVVARSTYCKGVLGGEVRAALESMASKHHDVLIGPDTDILLGDFRVDDCHFSVKGLDEAARLWADSIKPIIPALESHGQPGGGS